jgi:hypothetical protein
LFRLAAALRRRFARVHTSGAALQQRGDDRGVRLRVDVERAVRIAAAGGRTIGFGCSMSLSGCRL